jgi:hypothetical protein
MKKGRPIASSLGEPLLIGPRPAARARHCDGSFFGLRPRSCCTSAPTFASHGSIVDGSMAMLMNLMLPSPRCVAVRECLASGIDRDTWGTRRAVVYSQRPPRCALQDANRLTKGRQGRCSKAARTWRTRAEWPSQRWRWARGSCCVGVPLLCGAMPCQASHHLQSPSLRRLCAGLPGRTSLRRAKHLTAIPAAWMFEEPSA